MGARNAPRAVGFGRSVTGKSLAGFRPTAASSSFCSDTEKEDGKERKNFTIGFCRISNRNCGGAIAIARRGMSTSGRTEAPNGGGDAPPVGTPSFDESYSKIIPSFGSSPIKPEDEVVKAATTIGEASSGLPWDPNWYNLADQAVNVINAVHETTGLPYGVTIAAVTCVIRIGLFPLFVKSQQNTSRMAHMKPEMDALKEKIERIDGADHEAQMKYGMQMRALFKKYDCNPIKALMVPFIQAPVFMSMFFGLRKMPDYFPDELSTGGMLWFPDLTVPDPYYILPVASALSFLGMMELGKEAMLASNPAQGKMMLNAFRGLAFFMVPVTLNFHTGIFCYWMTNNAISLGQSIIFRNSAARKALGIWDPPKPVPGAESKGIVESIEEVVDKVRGGEKSMSPAEKIKAHNERIDNQKRAAAIAKGKTGIGRKRRRGKERV